jgi:hypothetical protein
MTELDFESDSFLTLLTDALRAGPGSPQWHEALRRLRAGGIEHADEYHLLVTAREHLESGKSYRSVRAGPGFTQRLMSALETDAALPSERRGPSTVSTIALASAAVVVVVLGTLGYWLFSSYMKPPGTRPDEKALFVNTIGWEDFAGELQPGWRKIGSLPVEVHRGALRHSSPATAPSESASQISGGGVVWDSAIASDEPFAVVANVRVHRPEENLIAQVFVTDQPDFRADNATSPHELVWLLQTRQAQVILPSGRIQAQSDLAEDFRGSLQVRVTIDEDQATVDLGDKHVWTGPHGLQRGKPRHVGVRFIKRSSDAGDGVVFQNVRVSTRQK